MLSTSVDTVQNVINRGIVLGDTAKLPGSLWLMSMREIINTDLEDSSHEHKSWQSPWFLFVASLLSIPFEKNMAIITNISGIVYSVCFGIRYYSDGLLLAFLVMGIGRSIYRLGFTA